MSSRGGHLPWVEYVVVAVSLLGTALVGLYFNRSGKASLEKYMFGDRRMSLLPITLSIAATLMSGSAVVTVGMESYLHGSQIMVSIYAMVLGSLVCYFFYIPVLRSLKSVSPFEFFDRRFDSRVRKFVSAMSVLDMMQFAVTSLYTPALTFSQGYTQRTIHMAWANFDATENIAPIELMKAETREFDYLPAFSTTGLHFFTIACGLAVLCLIYTATGGLKAVAWADSVQILIVSICAVCFFVVGSHKAGGISEVLRISEEGNRLELFNLDPSPFQRITLWTGIGIFFMWAPYYLSPSQHQRFLALPSEAHVKKVVLLSVVLMSAVVAFNITLGLVSYAYFAGCDPKLAQKDIHSYSTIIPYFIGEISKNLPGLTGLFHASVLAAGLSSVTSMWNTMACVILEDLIKPFLRVDCLEKTSYRIILCLVCVIAFATVGFVYWMPLFGSLMEVSIIMRSCSQSTMFVLFNSGLFMPWINSKGVVAGGLATVIVTIYVIVGSIKARSLGLVKDIPKILSAEKCVGNSSQILTNVTLTSGITGYGSHSVADGSVFWLFKFSPYLYMVPGVICGILVSIIISCLTGSQNLEIVDPDMIVRQMHWALPKAKSRKSKNIPSETVPLGKGYEEVPMNDSPNGENL